jgi:hypothetical protein
MASTLVNIVKDFTLTLVRDGERTIQHIKAGIQRLEAEVAGHWYTRAHSAEIPQEIQAESAPPAKPAKKS